MVLENASEGGSFDDDGAPASDGDSYNTTSPGGEQGQPIQFEANIDTSNFPKPIPVIGPLTGYTKQFYSTVLHHRLQTTMQTIERPMSQDEANAVAYWTAKQISVLSYGGPVGVLGAVYRARVTSDRFRFPFFQPDLGSFSKDHFPSPRMAWATGARATFLWHLSRYISYGALGHFFGKLLFVSYSASVTAVGELGDPRLKDMVKTLREKAQKARGQLPNQPRQPGMVDGVQQKDVSSLWKDHRQDIGDDTSSADAAYENADESTKEVSRHKSTTPYATMPRTPRWPSQATPAPQDDNPSRHTPFFGDEIDDASPTGGRGMLDDTNTTRTGSAWDRVRLQANTQSPNKTPSTWPSAKKTSSSPDQGPWSQGGGGLGEGQQQQYGGTVTVDSKDDQQAARELAQREFDARVERERRGGDFNAGGDQKRW